MDEYLSKWLVVEGYLGKGHGHDHVVDRGIVEEYQSLGGMTAKVFVEWYLCQGDMV